MTKNKEFTYNQNEVKIMKSNLKNEKTKNKYFHWAGSTRWP